MAQLCVAAVSLLVQKLMGVVADLGLSAAKSPGNATLQALGIYYVAIQAWRTGNAGWLEAF